MSMVGSFAMVTSTGKIQQQQQQQINNHNELLQTQMLVNIGPIVLL